MAINDGMQQRPSPSESPASTLPLNDLKEFAKHAPRETLDELDVTFDDETGELIQNPDGSLEAPLGGAHEESGIPFDANLAEHLDQTELDEIARDLIEKIEVDKKAREKRDEQYEEGIRRTGMGNDAPGGASFKGASKVVHPMLVEACVDFCASAIKELYPPAGPAKTKTVGNQNDQHKYAVSQRQERYLNWQLLEQISEFAEEFEQLLTQLPLGGSQYLKFWYDATLKRTCCEFVPIDDLFLPFACSDFYTAHRVTHVQRLTSHVFDERVEAGFYMDLAEHAPEPSQTPDQTKAEKANDKIEGRESDLENIDGERLVYEVNTFCELSCDKEEKLPYLVSIDEHSGKVVSIYRNWDEKDDTCTRLDWMVEFGFIAWRGAYKIGLPHLIGGLSAAATGALRALLDSAHFNNLPGYLRLKGARFGGQSKEVQPGSGTEVDGSAAVDDIRKLVMALPYNAPSPVLFELLGWLNDAGKGVVTTAEEKIADASSQMPVGTVLALIESGAKVYSSIHARLHRSMSRAFKILARLNKTYLSLGEQLTKLGEVLATRSDFADPLAVIPVSDPNIFSEAQRFAQMQMVIQLGTGVDPKSGQPTDTAKLHNQYEVVKRLYEVAKIPNFDRFLPAPQKPQELNAAAENVAATLGRPLMAFPHQPHFEHIETHLRYIIDPFLGGSQMAAQQTMPMMMEHVKQHLSYLYLDLLANLIQQATGESIDDLMQDNSDSGRVDKIIASASKIVHARLQQRLQPLGPVMDQILQRIASMQPPQPMDPAQAVIESQKIRAQADAAKTDKTLAAKTQLTQAQLQQKQGEHTDNIDLAHRELDQKAGDSAIAASQRQDELQLDAAKHGASLEQQDVEDLRQVAHESLQNDLDRAHEAAQNSQDHDQARQAQLADNFAQAAESNAARSHEAGMSAMNMAQQSAEAGQDRAHQSFESGADREHQAVQSAADRQHQAVQSGAERAQRSQEHADKLKDADKSRKHSAQVQRESETRKIKAEQQGRREQAKQEQQKPKGKGKAK